MFDLSSLVSARQVKWFPPGLKITAIMEYITRHCPISKETICWTQTWTSTTEMSIPPRWSMLLKRDAAMPTPSLTEAGLFRWLFIFIYFIFISKHSPNVCNDYSLQLASIHVNKVRVRIFRPIPNRCTALSESVLIILNQLGSIVVIIFFLDLDLLF